MALAMSQKKGFMTKKEKLVSFIIRDRFLLYGEMSSISRHFTFTLTYTMLTYTNPLFFLFVASKIAEIMHKNRNLKQTNQHTVNLIVNSFAKSVSQFSFVPN